MEIFDDFLKSDASSTLSRSNFLFLVQDIKSGNHDVLETTGNAYHVIVKKECVIIENLWDDSLSPIAVSLASFEAALREQ